MKRCKFLSVLMAVFLLMAGSALAEAELPAALEDIEESAFEGNAALKGVLTLPESVRSVGSRAFAGSGLHALILPEGCVSVAADALAGAEAAYIRMNGADIVLSGDAAADVPFVFAPAESAASALAGFYADETLAVQDGWYYSLTETEAIPLCAVDGTDISGAVKLPKAVNGLPVRSLDTLVTRGCSGMTELLVPSLLEIPAGLDASHYDAMTVSAPVSDLTDAAVGVPVTWTTEVEGHYGDVAFIWTFDTEGTLYSAITAEPTVTWTPEKAGACIVSVKAVDALNDSASAAGEAVNVAASGPVYRALLIGNTYPADNVPLKGCDTDAYAMRTVLSTMTGTPYNTTVRLNLSAAAIKSAIAATFAGTRSCDVSIFHFSGHGVTNTGAIVGVDHQHITANDLRACLDQIPGTKIVIIDACYSGNMIGKSAEAASAADFNNAFIRSFSAYTKDNLAANGYIVMTACTKGQKSQSLSDGTISFGAFTYGVCYGSGFDEWHQQKLSNLPADKDGNGAITLGEAYATALDRVAYLATMVSTMDQAAQFYGDTSFVLWSR